jgi:photosystem II stability/assembly factor-like uncharacterized protein
MRMLMRCLLVAVPMWAGGIVRAAGPAEKPPVANTTWEPCGWGGGGFYYAAAFHPAHDGVIYLAGDVGGVYRSSDHGQNWTMINNGLVDYGVFTLAVDRKNSDIVYAATEGGLCKSTDDGAHWRLLPKTGPGELHITGEKGKSIHCIAVGPANGDIVYAGTPAGKVYKSTDGGETWAVSYEKSGSQESRDALTMRFGQVNGDYFGGFWSPLAFSKDFAAEQCSGFGFSFKAEGATPRDVFLTLTTSGGIVYRSRDLTDLFKTSQWSDVVLGKADFTVDPDSARKHPDEAKRLPTPIWSTVNRFDFACVGSLPEEASIGHFGRFFFAFDAADPAGKPALMTVREFSKSKSVGTYGNIRSGESGGGSVHSVVVAAADPSLVLAATADSGLLVSTDSGATWHAADAPSKASSAAVSADDANIIYAAFGTDGVWKSTDKGKSWKRASQGLPGRMSVTDVAVSPANPLEVYAIGAVGWNGAFYRSTDGGENWNASSTLAADTAGDPTLPAEPRRAPLSTPTNLVINPLKPRELYISANWRSCMSADGGVTWAERDRGADISCIYDIRFSGARAYACAMDEGTLVSENNGKDWRQLWPLKFTPQISGHNWRLGVTPVDGADRVIAAASPWDTTYPNRVILSEDGGKSFAASGQGLPDYVPRQNTLWGQGYARAMAVDPKNPKVIFLGIDGSPEPGKSGGGIFKSEDGGNSWKQLAGQPANRRMFFGLAVDPTDSDRLYWGSCGDGLYRSEDGGKTWELAFQNERWVFNVMVAADGTVYCPGDNLWRSTDHGRTWKQITHLAGRPIVAMEVHPLDPATIWFATTTWDGSDNGAVYKTTDTGNHWQEITGNLPHRKPMVLRFNPQTKELWAGGVGLYRTGQ